MEKSSTPQYEIQVNIGDGWQARATCPTLEPLLGAWEEYAPAPRNPGAARLILVLATND